MSAYGVFREPWPLSGRDRGLCHSNAICGHMAEFGIVTRVGLPQIKELLAVIADRDDHRLPPGARACLESLGRQFLSLHEEICRQAPPCLAPIEPREPAPCNHTRHRTGYGERAGRLHRRSFSVKSGRELAAWIGLVPRKTQQVESSGSAKSPSRAISICGGCSSPGRWP